MSLMKACHWFEDDEGVWTTTCGETFEFFSDGPEENRFAYCPYCGCRLSPEPYSEECL